MYLLLENGQFMLQCVKFATSQSCSKTSLTASIPVWVAHIMFNEIITGIPETSTFNIRLPKCLHLNILVRTDHFICCRTEAVLISTIHWTLHAGLWMDTWTLLEGASSTASLMLLSMGWQEEPWHATLQAPVLFTTFGGEMHWYAVHIFDCGFQLHLLHCHSMCR